MGVTAFVQVSKTVRSFKVYDLHVCGKIAGLDVTELELPRGKPPILCVLWTSKCNIILMDAASNVYEVRKFGTQNKTKLFVIHPP